MELKEVSAILEEKKTSGNAMWMGGEVFAGVYRYMMRYLERYNGSAYKLLYTVVFDTKENTDEEKAAVKSAAKDILQESLRNSDILMQVGENHFFLLLMEIDDENVVKVVDRIERAWESSPFNIVASLIHEQEKVYIEHHESEENAKDYNWVAVVDDNSMNLKMAEHILKKDGTKVTTMQSGAELLKFLKDNTPDIILLDVMMPEMDGFETYGHLMKEGYDNIPIIFLTADDTDATETKGLGLGALDFIKKPFVPEVLTLRVNNSIELIRLQRNLADAVEKKNKENKSLFIHVVQSLADAIDAKDTYTNGHSGRVAKYSKMIAERAGFSSEEQDNIYMIGLLHDVGKIGIPDSVINKPGRLTDAEYEMIKNHPSMGARILKNIKEMPQLAIGARWHHERYDGNGYPNGLKGDDIPDIARIISVADAYDAMTSNRSYRKPLEQDVVRREIVEGLGTQFDPVYAQIMLDMIDEDKNYELKESDIVVTKKVLLADDSTVIHRIVEHTFNDLPQYELECVLDGEQCIKELESDKYDLVLLDLDMPVRNGFEVIKYIRNKEMNIRIVVLTGDNDIESIRMADNMDVDGYINKPIGDKVLREVLRSL